MISAAFIALVAALNIIRGQVGGKLYVCALIGLLAGLYAQAWIPGALVVIGLLPWAIPGWGRGFLSFHGDFTVYNQPEIPWLDSLARKIYPSHYTKTQRRIHGTIWMSLRALFAYPMFIALWVYLQSPLILLYGLLIALQGPIYALCGGWRVWLAEAVTGLLIGALLVGALWQ